MSAAPKVAHPRVYRPTASSIGSVVGACIAAACLALPVAVQAQVSRPLPDLSSANRPEVVAEGWKYFLFRREGVSVAQAAADLADCRRFVPGGSWAAVGLNRFVPWDSRAGRIRRVEPPAYGLVGLVIAGMVEGTLVRRDYQATMRRCMEPRGYTRYSVPEQVWKDVMALSAEESVAVQARIAAGPAFGQVPGK